MVSSDDEMPDSPKVSSPDVPSPVDNSATTMVPDSAPASDESPDSPSGTVADEFTTGQAPPIDSVLVTPALPVSSVAPIVIQEESYHSFESAFDAYSMTIPSMVTSSVTVLDTTLVQVERFIFEVTHGSPTPMAILTEAPPLVATVAQTNPITT